MALGEALPRGDGWRTSLAALVWGAAVAAGFLALSTYASTPGEATSAPTRWPAESGLALDARMPTLLMFVHPQCSCSRASLHELSRLLVRVAHRVRTRVVLVRPTGAPAEWETSELRALAVSIPDVEVVVDEGAIEATRFGARTSGACVLYDAEGALRFAGGITAARAHEGDSPGAERIAEILSSDGVVQRADAPVFGCALDDPDPDPDVPGGSP